MRDVVIDVGAHWGEVSLPYARLHPDVTVFAFEPDMDAATRLWSAAPNYVVILAAVSEYNALATLHLNRVPGCASLLDLDPDSLDQWPGGDNLLETGTRVVPTMRLDTFLNLYGIESVSWLKIDTQGADLSALRSLGTRIDSVQRVTVEVPAARMKPQYVGGHTKRDVMRYMLSRDFVLVQTEPQTDNCEENLTFERMSSGTHSR